MTESRMTKYRDTDRDMTKITIIFPIIILHINIGLRYGPDSKHIVVVVVINVLC